MHVKIAFISAKFKLRAAVVEQRAPDYLRAEGTGEDAAVASSFKQQSEFFLAPGADGGTQVRLKVKADLLGRLGAFGLNVMKNKADRMWDEFAVQLAARIASSGTPAAAADAPVEIAAPPPDAAPACVPLPAAVQARAVAGSFAEAASWWSRLTGRRPADAVIRIEVSRGDQTVRVEWPLAGARECQDWLRELMR
jgi:hypothetical protein